MSRSVAALLAALALAPGGAALAHHGWSSYDAARTIKVTAPLQDVEWVNPHGSAKVAYEGKTWTVVLAPLMRMEARGLTREMLTGGQPVTIEGYPRSDGTPEMRIERVTAGGRVVELR
jgi:hypothetical protein